VQFICDVIAKEKLYEKAIFSIDAYTPSVIEYALKSGFTIINDITGASDENIIHLALKYKAKLCIMHMQGSPQTMQDNPHYEDVMQEVSTFFEERIAKCEALGLERKDIILDVGIFGCEILVGASRKSLIDNIIPTPTDKRLAGKP